MMLVFCIILLSIVFLLPFLPGIREVVLKRDATPLWVRSDYVKNPCYFADSFKQKIQETFLAEGEAEGLRFIKLSKLESIVTIETASIVEDMVVSNVCCVKNTLDTQDKVTFIKELYVGGAANLGNENRVRALVCEGNITLGRGTIIERWIDAAGTIQAGEECDLGVSASCRSAMFLSPTCVFKRLYAFPVVAGKGMIEAPVNINGMDVRNLFVTETDNVGAERNLSQVPQHSQKHGSIITDLSLVVGAFSVVYGHIKTHGTLILEENVVIAGNLFAEGIIQLGAGCRIGGTVFSQDRVIVGPGVVIGTSDKIKSVVAKNGITLEANATVYGYVMTEGEGIVI